MIEDLKLFSYENQWYTTTDLYNALLEVGANDCDILFIHTDIMFGKKNPQLKRQEYLEQFYQVLLNLKVKTLIFPTFTFSFCNKEPYSIKDSKTYMGALNEYIRKKPEAVRSKDPLLSMVVIGEKDDIFQNIGNSSLGINSGYDMLHKQENVKFLFLGAEIGECFTYIHYMEDIMRVPYRFDMEFSGEIIDENSNRYLDSYTLYATCEGAKPACSYYFEEYLLNKGLLKKVTLANKPITCIAEKDAYKEIKAKLEENINYFLEEPFDINKLKKVYTKGKDGQRIISC